jgi:hypothetical protein
VPRVGPNAGEMKFHGRWEPPLPPDDYVATVGLDVRALNISEVSRKLPFTVSGPRFSVDLSDIACMYPPDKQKGNFTNVLPQIVFKRCTLPWELSSRGPGIPGMALLLFSGPEIPELKSVKAGDLEFLKKPPLKDFEKEIVCKVIELPAASFRTAAPSRADLVFTAHVREVNAEAKDTSSFNSDGRVSAIIGARFPEPATSRACEKESAKKNEVFLVSLEGIEDTDLPSSTPPPAGKMLRMVVLTSWHFYCTGDGGFPCALKNLTADTLKLNDSLASNNPNIEAAYRLGYAALNHDTRLGERTVSWYRGPLLPVKPVIRTKDYEFQASPDALVRYNYRNGMFDVSYSAAFQMGRLIALQDRPFTSALVAWRHQSRVQDREENRRLELFFALRPGKEVYTGDTLLKILTATINDATGAPCSATATEASVPSIAPVDPPQQIRDWLARLVLLYRVPFNYLVPDRRMLPSDSIRFFSLDSAWIKCLLDGACSIGRDSFPDPDVEKRIENRLFQLALESAASVRRQGTAVSGGSVEGFLMRSPLVEGWPGLEIRAWKTWDDRTNTGEAVEPLRIDRMSPDIMLCIFNGPVSRVEVSEPPEGMYLGATRSGNKYEKTGLRSIDALNLGKQTSARVFVALRDPTNPDSRVVDFGKTADAILQALKLNRKDPLTSAELALEMVESPRRVEVLRRP